MILYIIKSTIVLSLLLGCYFVFLDRLKTYRFNRIYLLGSLVLGLLAPLIPVNSGTTLKLIQQPNTVLNTFSKQSSEWLDRAVVPLPTQPVNKDDRSTAKTLNTASAPEKSSSSDGDIFPLETAESTIANPAFSIEKALFYLYWIVAIGFFIRLITHLTAFYARAYGKGYKEYDKSKIVLVSESIVPHSFMNVIFLNEKEYQDGKISSTVLKHELTHVRQYHSVDILFIELIKTFFWFNPVVYAFKYVIQTNHEYLADQAVLDAEVDAKSYMHQLIRYASHTSPLALSSTLNFSSTKKRIQMMHAASSKMKSIFRISLVVPLSLCVLLLFCDRENYSQYAVYADKKIEYKNEKESGKYLAHYDNKPYTGDVYYKFTSTDSLFSKQAYNDGRLVSSTLFDSTGVRKMQYRYTYIDDSIKMWKHISYSPKDSVLLEHWVYPTDTTLGYIKHHYPSGKIKFSAMFKGNMEFENTMTLYAEDGTILEQERYENGALVEVLVDTDGQTGIRNN
jgi:beta-lactamase regulating signal transducer with metallopeptidase domain